MNDLVGGGRLCSRQQRERKNKGGGTQNETLGRHGGSNVAALPLDLFHTTLLTSLEEIRYNRQSKIVK